MFRIDLLPAEYGDAIWIEYGRQRRRHRLLIDCGTSAVYPRLRERILALRESDRHFELLVITHVDADHIGGALDLLRQQQELGVTFGEIWFNGYVHLTPGGVVPRPEAEDILGPLQGEVLTELIVANGAAKWNAAVQGGALVVPESGPLQVLRQLPGGMKLTLLSPFQGQLDRLRPAWDAACRKAGIVAGAATVDDRTRLDEVEEPREEDDLLGDPDVGQLAARPFKPDRAAPNGTSIALLAEYAGRRALLSGDAFAPVMLDALARLPGNSPGTVAARRRQDVASWQPWQHQRRAGSGRAMRELAGVDQRQAVQASRRRSHCARDSRRWRRCQACTSITAASSTKRGRRLALAAQAIGYSTPAIRRDDGAGIQLDLSTGARVR
jgi:hypothetical protein